MKIILQQVKEASVLLVDENEKRFIGQGVIIYVCFLGEDMPNHTDEITKVIKLLKKMKILSLGSEKIDKTIDDVNGELLVISNFSIAGRMKKGTKVDFSKSASYDDAKLMYQDFLVELEKAGFSFKTGKFGAKMEIESKVRGPLNYVLDI